MSVKLMIIYTITLMFSINLKIPLSGKKCMWKLYCHIVSRKSNMQFSENYVLKCMMAIVLTIIVTKDLLF